MDRLSFTLRGHAVSAPQDFGKEKPGVQFNVAYNYKVGDVEKVTYYRVKTFNEKNFDNLKKYIDKGSLVEVSGIPVPNAFIATEKGKTFKKGDVIKSLDVILGRWEVLKK